MKLEVKFFARARDLVGNDQITLDVPAGTTVGQMKMTLRTEYPQLEPLLPHLHVAVDNDFAEETQILRESQEIACFPPVSGG